MLLRMPLRPSRGFNSIKVRLEPGWLKQMDFTRAFQFHKGTIRTLAKLASSANLDAVSIP